MIRGKGYIPASLGRVAYRRCAASCNNATNLVLRRSLSLPYLLILLRHINPLRRVRALPLDS